jgi:exonuclease III
MFVQCNVSIFPQFSESTLLATSKSKASGNQKKVVEKCGACNKQLGPQRGTCAWCGLSCHQRCIKGELGCTLCASDMLPGYNCSSHELTGNLFKNTAMFNPYIDIMLSATSNQNENNVDSEEAMYWQEASECLLNCNYRQHKSIPSTTDSDLKIFSLNIRSLNKHITQIRDDIEQYKKFDILCFNETSCSPENSAGGIADFEIDGFHTPILQKPCRSSCRGGGLAIYINEDTCSSDDFHRIDQLCCTETDTPSAGEFLFLEVNVKKRINKKVIVGTMYRSPSAQPTNFIESIKSKLQFLERHKKKHIIIAGDTNIDLIQHDNDVHAQNISDITLSHGFTEVISKPTRITDHSATLLDHIFTNSLAKTTSTGVLINDISDHLGTFINLNINSTRATRSFTPKSNQPSSSYRKFSTENIARFQQLISEEAWDTVVEESDVQTKYNNFEKIYAKHYNEAFPEITSNQKRKKQRVNPKPWILPWLEEACDRKNRFYHNFVKEPTTANKTKYTKMKKFVDKHIKRAKNKYYTAYFKEHHGNSKKQWQIINSLLNRGKRKSPTTKLFSADGTVLSRPKEIANRFNDYFCGIASSLKAQMDNHNTHPDDYRRSMGPAVANSIYLREADSSEIREYINSLKNKATADTKCEALKAVMNDANFTAIFASVLNASMAGGIFPSQLKLAKVCPIHKGDSKTDVSNYRPISLLPIFSKIFEKALHNRLIKFLEDNESLYDHQFGFRKRHSCEHALLAAQNTILQALDKKQIAMLLLIDFSKAFDMVDHQILLCKLSHYGIRGIALNLFESYLGGRRQTVTINNAKSEEKALIHGVPQGSILGPLLFVIYINDMPNIQKLAKFILYADDANIIITGYNHHEIISKYHELSDMLSKWVTCNGLMLNLKKTNYMIFSNIGSNDLGNYQPTMNNRPIEQKHVSKFLGVLMDDRLQWTHHIKSLSTKIYRNCGILYKMKGILPQKAMLILYHSFIQSHLNYCSLVWGMGTKNSLKTLFVGQKKAVRAIIPGYVNYYYNKKTDEPPKHTKQAFTDHKILTVHSLILKNVILFMCKSQYYAHLLPISITKLFTNILNHSVETIPQRLITQTHSMFVKGARLYNEVLEEATEANSTLPTHSLVGLKNKLKIYLMTIQSIIWAAAPNGSPRISDSVHKKLSGNRHDYTT